MKQRIAFDRSTIQYHIYRALSTKFDPESLQDL